jgi:hypothetical protein
MVFCTAIFLGILYSYRKNLDGLLVFGDLERLAERTASRNALMTKLRKMGANTMEGLRIL